MKYLKHMLLGFTLCALTACSSTQPAGSFQKVNELGQTKTATVRLKSGETFKADLLRVMADSAHFVHPATLFPTAVPTLEIEEVMFLNRKKGAFRGIRNVLVASAGTILLGVVVAKLDNYESQHYLDWGTGFTMIVLPIVAAPFTLTGGLVIGAVSGVKETYQVERPLEE